ncbi:MAG: type II toxin-antitoxin system RelB/DinJ family antitoxin [Fusobacteriaceae bacterium]|jgi:addiction module RelB/DinJ family antitoxin|nr:type II toxin-antitoxin system RelB/DinJ family antitoxin [Fusobacteriaceae bacterium]
MIASKNSKTANIHARVNPDVRKEAEEILNAMGMTISDYINLALYQVRITRRIPFELVADPPSPMLGCQIWNRT